MSNYRINTGYAKALLMLAEERGQREHVADDMRLVGQVCADNRELCVVLANPIVKSSRKEAIVQELFGGRVCAETEAFLQFIVRKNRTVNLRGICEAYLALWREARGIVLGDLVTHQPIADEEREAFIALLASYTGREVELQTRTDANMLGGFKLEFENNMYDARIRTKIRKLRMEFAKNDYERKL